MHFKKWIESNWETLIERSKSIKSK
jgi:hypothetical protein